MRKSLLALIAFLAAAPLIAGLPKGWVGRDTCATCHEDVAKAFVAGPHGRAMAGHTAKNQTKTEDSVLDRACESCHGPGEIHANDPSTKNIRTLKGASTADASSGCVSCHSAQKGGLAMRTHGHEKAGVACSDCHTAGHAVSAAEPLLARPRGTLCAGCHASQVAQFALPYAHREGKAAFECMSCHSVHGGTTVNGRIEENGQQRCVACHTEKAGPQVYPHPPMAVNGCVACHTPHGSPNPFLLNRASTTQLCLECHTDTPKFHDLSRPGYRACVTCHAAVHGSQRDPKLFQE
jgi:DmsE family decaheme c-type cytochrome